MTPSSASRTRPYPERSSSRPSAGLVARAAMLTVLSACWGTACQSGESEAGAQPSSKSNAPVKPVKPVKLAKQVPVPPADAVREPSGLITQVLQAGTGDQHPGPHDTVKIRFSGFNEKGKPLPMRGPEEFSMAGIIAGLREALSLMVVGERRRAWVPDKLGYYGRPGSPRAATVYDIEVLQLSKAVPPQAAPPDLKAPPKEAMRSSTGLAHLYLERGTGQEHPAPWDRVSVEYSGWTSEGELFESSNTRGAPQRFEMAEVIPGWAEVLPQMVVGDQVRLWVPEALAYGGRAGRPKGPLVFELTLKSIESLPQPPTPPLPLNAPPKDALRTESGLAYKVLEKGTGATTPKSHSRVQVHYSGWTADGELFDSSVVRGHPVTVPLNRMIPGWTEGVQKMTEGAHYQFWIPEKLAYGKKPIGKPGPLVYEIRLLKIVP